MTARRLRSDPGSKHPDRVTAETQKIMVEPIGTGLALLAADVDRQPRWIQITASGQHYARQGDRSVPLSDDDIHSMHRGFQTVKTEQWFSRGAPVTVNHATMSGALDAESTKALAYIIDTRVEAVDGRAVLMGLADYTDEGRRRIRAGEFQGFSIEAIPPASARSKRTGELLGEWALIGGTLTNHPFVPGLSALAASEDVTPNPEIRMLTLLSRLGLAEDATEPAVLAELDRQLAERDAQITTLGENLATVTADRDAKDAKLSELVARDKVRTLDDACAAGRCSAAEREDYWKALTLLGEEHAHRVYPEQRIATAPRSLASVAPAGESEAGSIYTQVHQLAEKIAGERGIHPSLAFASAYREIVNTPEAEAAFQSAEA